MRISVRFPSHLARQSLPEFLDGLAEIIADDYWDRLTGDSKTVGEEDATPTPDGETCSIPKKAAVYGRYSGDHQKPTSVEDQITPVP